MVLYIDTTKKNNIKIIIEGKQVLINKSINVKFNHAEILLPLINNLLKARSLALNNIKKIIVENNNGSFTSLRIGVVAANALGYALNIPIESKSESNFIKNKKINQTINIVNPIYTKEPNITIHSN